MLLSRVRAPNRALAWIQRRPGEELCASRDTAEGSADFEKEYASSPKPSDVDARLVDERCDDRSLASDAPKNAPCRRAEPQPRRRIRMRTFAVCNEPLPGSMGGPLRCSEPRQLCPKLGPSAADGLTDRVPTTRTSPEDQRDAAVRRALHPVPRAICAEAVLSAAAARQSADQTALELLVELPGVLPQTSPVHVTAVRASLAK